MRLISPIGVVLTVSDSRGEVLKREGYTEPQATAAPVPSPARRTRRKTVKEPEDGVRDSG